VSLVHIGHFLAKKSTLKALLDYPFRQSKVSIFQGTNVEKPLVAKLDFRPNFQFSASSELDEQMLVLTSRGE
jgi:hypothetical protein